MNWDKPLPKGKANSVRELSPHHGYDFEYGTQWRDLVGVKKGEDFYTAYVRFCFIMNSPLGQALT